MSYLLPTTLYNLLVHSHIIILAHVSNECMQFLNASDVMSLGKELLCDGGQNGGRDCYRAQYLHQWVSCGRVKLGTLSI